ncbi:proton-conducting transporter membrane subunit [Chloroflexota bacterium]
MSSQQTGDKPKPLPHFRPPKPGYLMMGLAAMGLASAGDVWSRSGVLFFLASYTFANLGAFAVIIAISNKTGSDDIADFSGMFKRAPFLTLGMSLCFISLLGLPPTSGLIAKVYIFNAAMQQGLGWLVVMAVINSVISAFYYMRVVKIPLARGPRNAPAAQPRTCLMQSKSATS